MRERQFVLQKASSTCLLEKHCSGLRGITSQSLHGTVRTQFLRSMLNSRVDRESHPFSEIPKTQFAPSIKKLVKGQHKHLREDKSSDKLRLIQERTLQVGPPNGSARRVRGFLTVGCNLCSIQPFNLRTGVLVIRITCRDLNTYFQRLALVCARSVWNPQPRSTIVR